MSVRRETKFICQECNLVFELLDPLAIGRNERKYCPKCGDHFAVRAYKNNKNHGSDWSEYELSKLEDYMNGEIKLYTLVKLTGRTEAAISRMKYRINSEKGKVEKPPWSDEEKFYGDLCLNGEITPLELSKKTGRSIEAARSYVKNVKAKLKKQGVTL